VIDTPWGGQADFHRAGVQRYFADSVHHTLGEFRMDGYRFDAVMAMTDSAWTSQWSPGQQIVRDMNDAVDNRYQDATTIAEIYIDNAWVTNPTDSGLGYTAQYHNEFKEALRSAVYDAAFNASNMPRLAAVVDGSGAGVEGTGVFHYLALPDDAWPLTGHQRMVRDIDNSAPHDDQFARGRTTMGQGINLFSRGIPAFLQGTEWLEDNGWESSKIDWAHRTAYAGTFRYYQDAIRLRTGEPALAANSPIQMIQVDDAGDVIAFERYELGGKSFVIVANFSNTDYTDYRIGLPREGTWGVVLNNQESNYGGSGLGTSGTFDAEPGQFGFFSQSASLELPAMGLMVLEHEPTPACPADVNADGSANPADFTAWLSCYNGSAAARGCITADVNRDGLTDNRDFTAWLGAFANGCP